MGNKHVLYKLTVHMENKDLFFAEIPYHISGKTINYYLSASSISGRKETAPRTAPAETYQFTIK